MRRKIAVRSAVIECCVLISLLLIVLIPLAAASGASVPGAVSDTSLIQPAGEFDVSGYTFRVTWNATVTGEETTGGGYLQLDWERDYARLQGSAILNYSPDPNSGDYPWLATSYEQSYSDDRISRLTDSSPCWSITGHSWVTDSGRWMGATGLRTNLWIDRDAKGAYMYNPATHLAAQNYTIRFEHTEISSLCERSTYYRDSQSGPYPIGLQAYPTRLEADNDTMTSFTANYEEHIDWTPPLTVTWKVTARRMGGCKDLPAPIDATNPAFVNGLGEVKVGLQATQPSDGVVSPDSEGVFKVRVTCDGNPVKNAYVAVSLDVDEKSGGHAHGNQDQPRPRGSLRSPGAQGWTKIDADWPSITVMTDDKGSATVGFRPGLDLEDYRRGIAGTYTVKARLDNSNEDPAELILQVKTKGFVQLPLPGLYYVVDRSAKSFKEHPLGVWGTPAAIDGVQKLAQDFWAAQVTHNQELTATGKTA